MRDLANNLGVSLALSPAVQAATIKGNTIDTKGFGSLAFVVNTGAIASSGNFTITVEESATTTDGDFTAVAAADLAGSTLVNPLTADGSFKVSYIGNMRYARVVATKNSGTSIAAGAVAIKGMSANKPI